MATSFEERRGERMRRIHARFLVKIIELRARIAKKYTYLRSIKFYFYMPPVLFFLSL